MWQQAAASYQVPHPTMLTQSRSLLWAPSLAGCSPSSPMAASLFLLLSLRHGEARGGGCRDAERGAQVHSWLRTGVLGPVRVVCCVPCLSNRRDVSWLSYAHHQSRHFGHCKGHKGRAWEPFASDSWFDPTLQSCCALTALERR